MSQSDRLISAGEQGGDAQERAMRPKRLIDYRGQEAVAEQLELAIAAALKRKEELDHVLLYGPPGLGKTTLANIVANELDVRILQTSGPVLERPGDLAAILTNLEKHDVLFIDEIHRLSPLVEEVLYPAMEDNQIDIMTGDGASARSFKIDLPPFTLVGATTRAGLLTAPLRDRFGIVQRLELRVRDYAEIRADGHITREVADQALNLLNVDKLGLDSMDRRLLMAIIEKFDGGPVGVDNLGAALSEDAGTLEEVVEPYLIQQGLMMRTPRGRVVTPNTHRHFGLAVPAELET